jgi:2-dehydro-3-deoxyphosphogluconate aldolase/(4S)-4-hydroxy-2-oxoglutarate aldolase
MKSLFPETALHRLSKTRVIAVLVIDNPSRAVKLAQSLLAGGVDIMELTLRTPAALECLKAISAAVPEMMAGAGTIIFPEQVDQVVEAGAAFGVAPGTNPVVIRRAISAGLPFAPGVVTPTDVDMAVQCGCRELKFFPAEPSGGLNMLASIKAPYAHLGLKYIPLGGVTTGNLKSYLSDPDVIAVGGSWLAKKENIDGERWNEITAAAREASEIARAMA